MDWPGMWAGLAPGLIRSTWVRRSHRSGPPVVTDVSRETSTRWEVLAVGPGKRGKRGERIPCDIKPGDVVVLGPYNDFEDGHTALFQEGDIRYVEPTPRSV